ncbi:hypothetical protein AQUSIP_19330 [Aquicella siphonis]|uniref:DUF1737 domain-containing protein n=1 Tax=Aquicella siphonis TaxID=254247 RepID=A0A5E4PHV3_9COXI|nr:DUF1737 domain-containing protein [Aquicella siphonis]VVC76610.1 hypothetical protein AQUSIP_19330 [Aquicella siphonis]
MQYILITSIIGEDKSPIDTEEFSRAVTDKLLEGYELSGSAGAVLDPKYGLIYTQAMIKRE